ncbi:hypothetical protein [Paraburkholderia sp.]|uniref:hypothetical protein n=1 Tax=Paraburkholderia sp. TaxID=1926495 RepID=UPI002384DF1A|nr:hypothetical protein [Paraburkholderia sp.]MDE1179460.1 hypothetical protein [Paraburkholderia sp.]
MKTPNISDLDVAFGTVKGLPDYASIPEEFKRGNTKWNKLFSAWFYGGLKSLKIAPHEGVDKAAALKHIKALMASWEPKHEHKEAGVAYLMSKYFADVEWERA